MLTNFTYALMAPKIGTYIERIDQLESTNNYAASLLLTKRLPDGSIIVTNSQIGGRGQGSNKWESEPDRNLTFSIILYPDFVEITKQFEISKAISLGVADFLQSHVNDVSIKWPNDIYIRKAKVAGILLEYSIRRSRISSCIVGIGLNINQIKFLSDAPNPCLTEPCYWINLRFGGVSFCFIEPGLILAISNLPSRNLVV